MPEKKRLVLAIWLLRIALAGVFFYAAIASFTDPNSWIGYFPLFMRALVPQNLLLAIFSIYELILGGALLYPRTSRWAALMATLTLVGIVAPNLLLLDIVFRDLALALAAGALFILSRRPE